jgi:hypothetical protein
MPADETARHYTSDAAEGEDMQKKLVVESLKGENRWFSERDRQKPASHRHNISD